MKGWLMSVGMTRLSSALRIVVLLMAVCLPALTWSQGRPDVLWTKEGSEFFSVAYSPDGQILAAKSSYGIHLYRTSDNALLRTLTCNSSEPSPAFSPDGQYIATFVVYYQGNTRYVGIAVWRVSTGRMVHLFEIQSPISSYTDVQIDFSADGRLLMVSLLGYSSSYNNAHLKVWRLSDGLLQRDINLANINEPRVAAFSPDKQYLAIADSYDRPRIKIFRVADGSFIRSWDRNTYWDSVSASCITFSPDGQYVAIGGRDSSARGAVVVYRVSDGQHMRTYAHHDSSSGSDASVTSVAYSPSGRLASVGVRGQSSDTEVSIRFWDDYNYSTVIVSDRTHSDARICFSPDGQHLAISAGRGHVLRLSDNAFVHSFGAEARSARAALSPDGAWLATSGQSEVRLWDVASGNLVFSLAEGASDLAFSPNGQYLATAGSGGTKLRRASDGSLIRTLYAPSVERVAFSPNSLYLAAATSYAVQLWRIDGLLMRTLDTYPMSARVVAFSPDGQLLMAAGIASYSPYQSQVQIWRLMDGTRLRTITLDSQILCGAFSPDGQYIAVGDKIGDSQSSRRFGHVHVWRVADGSLYRTFSAHMDGVNGVAFSSDGRFLISASDDATISISQLSDGALMQIYDQDTASGVTSLTTAPRAHPLFAYTRGDGTLVVARYRIWGDIDGDGCVNDNDMLQMLFAFGQTVDGDAPEDISRDGVVDDLDLLLLLLYFGSGC